MTIFGWSCREPVEHSSPGGHCSSKWHPSKLFRASQCGGFDGRFALSSPVSSSTEINRKAPTDTRRARRGVRGAGRGCAGMSVTGTRHSSPQLKEWDLSPLQGVYTGVSVWELGVYAGRGACPSLKSPNPSDQISSSCSTGASAPSSPQAPA